jgi:ferritin-like metal-binding protein YciE
MSLNSFDDLIKEQLQDLYSAEKQFAEAQPAMAQAATDPALRDALEQHVQVTKEQIQRLESIARELGFSPTGKTCAAAKGLVQEGKEILEEGGDPMVVDAALIAAAQRIEHYEIAGYGTLRAHVKRLGNQNVEQLLEQTLAEERGADVLLTDLAEHGINKQAAS